MMQQVLYDFFSFSKSRVSFFYWCFPLRFNWNVEPNLSLSPLSLSLFLSHSLSLTLSLSLYLTPLSLSNPTSLIFAASMNAFQSVSFFQFFSQNTTPSFAISAWYSLTESLSNESFHWRDINVWVSDAPAICCVPLNVEHRTLIERYVRSLPPTTDYRVQRVADSFYSKETSANKKKLDVNSIFLNP